MRNARTIIWILTITVVAAVLYFWSNGKQTTKDTASSTQQNQTSNTTTTPVSNKNSGAIAMPINNALTRITKKPFGIYITPKNSPVQPEKFTGYHTGTDFETTPDEQNSDAPVYALCGGTIKAARYASGYGGVIVEACKINNQDVTVIYGHVRQTSIIPQLGQTVKAGAKLALLGTGFSSETDGERKHLHLGIHKGTAINISGYTQASSNLTNWIDPVTILK